jgi:Domain of unknown function (DUF6458)
MGIGTGIVLFVFGAALTFALNFQVGWINLDLVGILLMGAGAVVFILGLVSMLRKRQTITTVHSSVDPKSGESVAQRRTAVTNDAEVR